MPEISRFFGILIMMLYNEHNPPHFHAEYAGVRVQIGISPIVVLKGQVTPRIRSFLFEWTAIHQSELLENWERCRNGQKPFHIEGLE